MTDYTRTNYEPSPLAEVELLPAPPDAQLLRTLAKMLKEGNLVERDGKMILEITAVEGEPVMVNAGFAGSAVKAIIRTLDEIADWIVLEADVEKRKQDAEDAKNRDRYTRCWDFFGEQLDKAMVDDPKSDRTLDLVATYLKVFSE